MKHLRVYENFDEYYRELTQEEKIDFFNNRKRVLFTDSQVDTISKLTNCKKIHQKMTAPYRYGQVEKESKTAYNLVCGDTTPYFNRKSWFYIRAYEDEWFEVEINHRVWIPQKYDESLSYYLCDGFEGLIKFVDDFVAGKVNPLFRKWQAGE